MSPHIANTDLNLLKVFEALYTEGSASRAAILLGVTQSAVSAALSRLRLLYDEQLFIRTGRGLKPTLLASQLKPVVSEALDKCRQSLSMALPAPENFAGRSVTIGLSDDFEIAIGQKLIGILARRAPRLRIIFRQSNSQIIEDALLDRSIDLAISAGGISSRSLSRELLAEGRYSCVVDPQYTQLAMDNFDVQQFIAQDQILVSSGGFIGVVDEALAALGLKRSIVASTTHFAALPYLLKGTQAIATIPDHAAQAIAKLSGLRVLPCPVDLPRYPVELSWRTQELIEASVTEARAAIIECFSAFNQTEQLAP
ncbi:MULTISPECIES: LysR family transcriptional regulator [unclassified Raoultella]|uniref:LysR family transcriptional regulator n=1 Tax=unclassified Raoultella TaxID=2627600 RepID=UPI001359CDA5|nr:MULTISPECIES: LysR family transcriptional regulator [unclassified Raoultella]